MGNIFEEIRDLITGLVKIPENLIGITNSVGALAISGLNLSMTTIEQIVVVLPKVSELLKVSIVLIEKGVDLTKVMMFLTPALASLYFAVIIIQILEKRY